MTILICGSRNITEYSILEKAMNFLNFEKEKPFVIISGGAQGADSLAEEYTNKNNCNFIEIQADWEKNGKAAGFIRNSQMLELKPDLIVALWDGKSRGTADTLKKAKKLGIPTFLYYSS